VPVVRVWQPANEVERELASCLGQGDQPTYFQRLAAAQLFLPVVTTPGPDGTPQLVSWRVGERRYLPVFTSVTALTVAGLPGVDAVRRTSWRELRDGLPATGWALAVDPYSPIGVCVLLDGFDAAVRGVLTVPQLGPLPPSPTRPGPLLQAIDAADPDAYLAALLGEPLLVPVTEPPDYGLRPTGPNADGQFAVLVYTDAAQRPPDDRAYAAARLADVLRVWPDPDWWLVVDPGSEQQLVLAPQHLRELSEIHLH
jgi:hypothetical protein